jgi:hypothetical protein
MIDIDYEQIARIRTAALSASMSMTYELVMARLLEEEFLPAHAKHCTNALRDVTQGDLRPNSFWER